MFSMLCYNIQQAILQCSADYVAMFSSDTIVSRLCYPVQQAIEAVGHTLYAVDFKYSLL